ncbi:hypothetical protein SAMN04489712_105512 [Thermomonospora echinospora]|uniref:TrbL/VirB6 plasmid conjugal transfer protein n=1 Tax=Thermomonospora echinospora TaxID=1992 RepID=A0A1H6AJZ2_9ACTN|nr:hypothetical protein [Thermomonospora echinospora]SEG49059.1 hypothetical protein SAMN04489712_105512 [Thermomonospora echinospora]
MSCGLFTPGLCRGLLRDGLDTLAGSAFDAIVRSFISAANTLLEAFAKAFVAIPPIDLDSPGITGIYGTSLGLATVVAALLLLGQVIRTAVTQDGSALAQGVVGLIKAALAILLTVAITGTALRASDELTDYIVVRSFGSTRALTDKLAHLIVWNQTQGLAEASALLLILAVVGIVLTLVLWFELLLRNAAIAALVATSPIAAAGLVTESTRQWWTKTAVATAQLIVLKPVIALVFALGFGMTGQSKDIQGLLAGMLILLLAVFAWPAIARFFSFASAAVGGSTGFGALLGAAAGHTGGGSGRAPAGVEPDQFSREAEARTMATFGGGRGGGAVGPAALMAGVQTAQKVINSLGRGIDQTAAHAGMSGRPATYSAGFPTYPGRYRSGGHWPADHSDPPVTGEEQALRCRHDRVSAQRQLGASLASQAAGTGGRTGHAFESGDRERRRVRTMSRMP